MTRDSEPKAHLKTTLATLLLAAFLFAAAAVTAQPTFQQVTGHAFGERITTHPEMVRFLEALAEASPRVALHEQGKSWEERRLLAVVVTSPSNHARLEEIRRGIQRLADPRRITPEEASELAAELPAVVWLGGSIHGNELSGAEGILEVLERLTREEGEAGEEARAMLEELVVIVDPMINPDGRDRFAHDERRTLGRQPNPRRDHWGNDYSSWDRLAHRTGHYFFDTNRDWFAHTQRETRHRTFTFREWRPQVAVDAHEMGPDAEFFFDPATGPWASWYPDFTLDWFERFHDAYATAFDAAGFDYMSRERYNYFYPGYTTSWSSYQGAVGMLYEQGSSVGLAYLRADDTVRTLADALEQQATAAWAALDLVARERRQLLEDWHAGLRWSVEEGSGAGGDGVRRYLVAPGGDPGSRWELAALLLRNGIEVGRLTEEVRLGGVKDRLGDPVPGGARTFPAGTLVVDTAQPRGRLVRALLAPDQPVPQAFLEEARARVDKGESPRFYDITSWSLPLMFDLPGFASTDGPAEARQLPVEALSLADYQQPSTTEPTEASYAYLLDGRQAATMAALAALRRPGDLTDDGLRVSVTLEPTRIGGRDVASGSGVVWISPRDGQPAQVVRPAVLEVAERFGLEVTPLDTGLTDLSTREEITDASFAALGSGDVVPLRDAQVAVLAGEPVHAYSFGWSWWTLDRLYRIPLTVRRVGSLADQPLDDFDSLLIPDLFSAEALVEAVGEAGRERLARWVRDGGTLVVLGHGVDFARELELVSLGSWYPEAEAANGEGGSEGAPESPQPARYTVPGAFLGVELDPGSWLTAGHVGSVEAAREPAELPALVVSDRIYTAPPGPVSPAKRAVGTYAAEGGDTSPQRAVLLSGHAWEESLDRLPGAVFLWDERVGRGRVVAFAEDPAFRGYWRGAHRLLLNALLLGPSAP